MYFSTPNQSPVCDKCFIKLPVIECLDCQKHFCQRCEEMIHSQFSLVKHNTEFMTYKYEINFDSMSGPQHKTNYTNMSENSFQEQRYKPVQSQTGSHFIPSNYNSLFQQRQMDIVQQQMQQQELSQQLQQKQQQQLMQQQMMQKQVESQQKQETNEFKGELGQLKYNIDSIRDQVRQINMQNLMMMQNQNKHYSEQPSFNHKQQTPKDSSFVIMEEQQKQQQLLNEQTGKIKEQDNQNKYLNQQIIDLKCYYDNKLLQIEQQFMNVLVSANQHSHQQGTSNSQHDMMVSIQKDIENRLNNFGSNSKDQQKMMENIKMREQQINQQQQEVEQMKQQYEMNIYQLEQTLKVKDNMIDECKSVQILKKRRNCNRRTKKQRIYRN